jgi:hypothetical protein
MPDYKQTTEAVDRQASRIENDVEQLKRFTDRVESMTSRIIRNARSLGYFEPPKDTPTATPMPVITTLADAIQQLDRAIDHCSGSLNVFD